VRPTGKENKVKMYKKQCCGSALKNADADPGKNLDADADSCPY
jgi:hypothetical protein